MTDIPSLQQALGHRFKDSDLLELALVHRSYCNENPAAGTGHNERLEFLGDAVLDFIAAEKLYSDNTAMTEGEMTKRRSYLVRRETLARVSVRIKLGDYLLMGKGEESTGGRTKVPNLAGAMEAVIAAVYLDGGIEAARGLVVRLLEGEWDKPLGAGRDFKSYLQEVSQARFQSVPVYQLKGESGPDHDKRFRVEVQVSGRMLGGATGKTKKAAENEAARLALERLGEGFTD